jgi:hypothetical protein
MSDVVPSQTVTNREVEAFLTSVDAQINDDPAAVAASIVASILAAPDAESVLQQASTTAAEDVLGQRLLIRGQRFNKSDKADGPGFYALIDAVNDDGEVMLITCGARNVMAQIYRLSELNALPCHAAIVQQEKPTAAGFYPMSLEGRQAP